MLYKELLSANVVPVLALIALLAGSANLMQGQQTASVQQVSTVDGNAGPCSVEFTVIDGQGTPVYAATVDVHFAYGFMGVHKLDLEAGTNIDGKVRFIGLPKKVKDGTMFFRAAKGSQSGTVIYNPNTNCTASERIDLFAKQ